MTEQTKELMIAMLESQLAIEKETERVYKYTYENASYVEAKNVFNGLLYASRKKVNEIERQLNELKK